MHHRVQLSLQVLEGYNACVFAYGATGGGKTFTMVGTQDNPGCMVRALNDLFRTMEDANDTVFKVNENSSHCCIFTANIGCKSFAAGMYCMCPKGEGRGKKPSKLGYANFSCERAELIDAFRFEVEIGVP